MEAFLLLGGLVISFCQACHASPAILTPRSTTTVTASAATITPHVVLHGPLDDAGIESMLQSLSSSLDRPAPTSPPEVKRDTRPAVVTTSIAPFLMGDVFSNFRVACAPSKLINTTLDGPIQTLKVVSDLNLIAGLQVTSVNGSTAEVKSDITPLMDPHEDTFVFGAEERIAEFTFYYTAQDIAGFGFQTNSGRSFERIVPSRRDVAKSMKIPVGSGILARIRTTTCAEAGNIFESIGFDFLDELDSLSISNMSYTGFTNGSMPAGTAHTLTVGSMKLRNQMSVEQTMSLQTTQAVTQEYSISATSGWNLGITVTVGAEVDVPGVAKGSLSTAASWGMERSETVHNLTGTTITQSATFQLNCPPYTLCVAYGFFSMYKLDIKAVATLQAKTKSGASYEWKQNVQYAGSDSLDLELRVDQANISQII